MSLVTHLDVPGVGTYEVAMTTRPDQRGVRSITITARRDAAPISGTTLRSVALRRLVTTALAKAEPEPDAERVRLEGPTITNLRRAAAIYAEAERLGVSPLRSLEVRLGLSHTTATRWMRRVRELGTGHDDA